MTSHNKLAVFTLLLLSGVIATSKILNLDWQKVYSFDFTDHQLGQLIEQDLQGQPGNFAVVVKRIGNKDADFSLHEDQVFPTASLYKLVLMAATFDAIKSGKLSMDTQLSSTKTHLDQVLDDDGSSYPDAPSSIGYQVNEALDRIARISDNYAAIMLTEKLRAGSDNDPLQHMAKQLGMSHTDFTEDQPVTTAQDIALFFSKLDAGEVVSKDASGQIIELLKRNQIVDRIPAGLPQGVKSAHKTGELPYLRHDAGIVYLEGKPYIIVLMSEDLVHEDDGVETLAKISKDVYNYFSKSK